MKKQKTRQNKKGNHMKYRTLGKTGLKVSRLGFGGIPIQKTDAATTRKLIETMVEKGINYIDTARAKGRKRLGIIVVHALRNAVLPVVTMMAGYFTSAPFCIVCNGEYA
mgnify:CR=1 FL=1